MKKSSAGFTLLEVTIVVGILIILASLLWPSLSATRLRAKKALCANNLTQIHRALIMYSFDNNRLSECYPAYLTNLFNVTQGGQGVEGAYISDERVFVCPMDNTNATRNSYGVTSLKPLYKVTSDYGTSNYTGSLPHDDKREWAERTGNVDPIFGTALGQRNCSYLYEFSGRICQSYQPDNSGGSWVDDSPTIFCSTSDTRVANLVSLENAGSLPPFFPPTPYEVVREALPLPEGSFGTSGQVFGVTWQDAKLFQLIAGDIYCSGSYNSTDAGFPGPPPNFTDPIDYYSNLFADPNNTTFDGTQVVTSYSRTWMPMIRCFWHVGLNHIDSEAFEEVQNISLDGAIFNTAPFWERTAFKYGSSLGDGNGQ